MKNTILINQEVMYRIDPKLDVIDMCIYEYVLYFSHIAKKTTDKGYVWFWISAKKIIDDMPMLRIKCKRAISKRIDKLIDAGLLIRYPDNESMRESYFRVGEKYEVLNRSEVDSQRGIHILGGVESKFHVTPNTDSTNTYINDNYINDISNSEFEKNSQSEHEFFDEIYLIEEEQKEKKVAQKKRSSDLSVWPSFEDFWELYDKKTGKEKAEKKWQKLKQGEKEKIMQVIPDYKLSQPDKQYRKNPETYLNGKHWEDELIFKGKKMDAVDQLLAENGLTLNDLNKFRL